jgi:hypothetical protein
MTIVPIRDLGKLGVNTDWNPVDIPIEAFTMGSNVRFTNNRIQRGPVFSKVGSISNSSPRYAVSYKLLNSSSQFLICNDDGTIHNWQVGNVGSSPSETDVSISGYTASANPLPWTACLLNDVV